MTEDEILLSQVKRYQDCVTLLGERYLNKIFGKIGVQGIFRYQDKERDKELTVARENWIDEDE